MALKTKVPVMYRTPYVSRQEVPADVSKIMRMEITNMRKNLLKKQQRLKNSKEFSDDPRLTEYLRELKVGKLKTDRQVQNAWSRLRGLEKSNTTSITGKRNIARMTLETLRDRGLTNINAQNIAKFGEFVAWVKDTFGQNAYASADVETYFQESGDISVEELQRGYEEWLETH